MPTYPKSNIQILTSKSLKAIKTVSMKKTICCKITEHTPNDATHIKKVNIFKMLTMDLSKGQSDNGPH